jgi:hypothetical protein
LASRRSHYRHPCVTARMTTASREQIGSCARCAAPVPRSPVQKRADRAHPLAAHFLQDQHAPAGRPPAPVAELDAGGSGPIATLLIHKRPVSKSPPRPIGVGTGKTAIRAGSFSPARPFRHHPQYRRHGQRTAGREGGWPWPTSASSSTGKRRTKSRQPHWFR